jgi:hypothetical protein
LSIHPAAVTIHLPLAISHKKKDTAVIDLVQAWAPPFDPSVVVAEASEIVKGMASHL